MAYFVEDEQIAKKLRSHVWTIVLIFAIHEEAASNRRPPPPRPHLNHPVNVQRAGYLGRWCRPFAINDLPVSRHCNASVKRTLSPHAHAEATHPQNTTMSMYTIPALHCIGCYHCVCIGSCLARYRDRYCCQNPSCHFHAPCPVPPESIAGAPVQPAVPLPNHAHEAEAGVPTGPSGHKRNYFCRLDRDAWKLP